MKLLIIDDGMVKNRWCGWRTDGMVDEQMVWL